MESALSNNDGANGNHHEAKNMHTEDQQEQRSDEMDTTGGGVAMPTVFLGNLDPNCIAEDVQDMFERHNEPPIPVLRVDMKRGFCFVYLKDAQSPADKERIQRYVEEINGIEVEKVSRQLRAEFARGDGRVKRKEDIRREKIVPNETLFVVNFHEETTRKEDLEMLFQPYGELIRIDMKRNYAFVQFATVDQAKAAKEATNGGKLDQSAITVEYVARRMSDDRRPLRDSRPRGDDYRGGRPYRERGGYDRQLDNRGGGRDDRGRRGGGRYEDGPPRERRGAPFRGDDRDYDRPPPRGGPRGGGGWRDDRSPDRFGDYDRPRRPSSRSRSRSPPMYRKPRGGGGRDSYMNGGRDRDEYRGSREVDSDRRGGGRGGGYDRGGARERSNDRDYDDYRRGRSSGGGAGYERGYRSDERGYGGGRSGEVEGGESEAR